MEEDIKLRIQQVIDGVACVEGKQGCELTV